MMTNVIISKYYFALLILFFFSCNNSQKDNTIWFSKDQLTILDIDEENKIWKIYISTMHNSIILNEVKRENDKIQFKCGNSWCFLMQEVEKNDTISFEMTKTENSLTLQNIKNHFNHYDLVPFKKIKWDSIRIMKGYPEKLSHHATLMNNEVDSKNKSIMAWMIFSDGFEFSNVPKRQGRHSSIFLNLYKDGEIIGLRNASALFFDMDFEQDLGFYKKK